MAITGSGTISLEFRRDAGTVVVRMVGELDASTGPVLRRALRDLIEEQGNLFVRLDLADVSFIDRTGLSVLVGGLRSLREKGGELTLTNVGRSALRVLEVTGCRAMFTIDPE